MEERGWAYWRRQPEGTVLYEAVRDNPTTLLVQASEVGRGLPRYVERDFARYLDAVCWRTVSRGCAKAPPGARATQPTSVSAARSS